MMCHNTGHFIIYVIIQAFQNMCHNTGRFIMFSVITNIYNKKTKEPTLMELFTATGKLRTMQKTDPKPFNVIFSG